METYNVNYQNKLNSLQEYLKEDSTGTKRSCIEVLRSQVDEVVLRVSGMNNSQGEDLGEVFLRTISKDLSRYHDSFAKYQKALSEMKTSNLMLLRRKIVTGDKDFFKETWKEDSDNFFRTRKFISSYLKDLSLASKINSSLDCIVTGLYRYTLGKYGE